MTPPFSAHDSLRGRARLKVKPLRAAAHQQNLRQLTRRVVLEVEGIVHSPKHAGVGLDELVHVVDVAGEDLHLIAAAESGVRGQEGLGSESLL